MPVKTKFRRFPELPAELRLRIWKFALPDSRIVLLQADHRFIEFREPKPKEKHLLPFYNKNSRLSYRHVSTLKSGHRVPAMLSTCIESRRLALKNYKIMFSILDDGYSGFARTYFDCSVDILYLNAKTFETPLENPNDDRVQFQDGLKSMDRTQLARVQHLCITSGGLNRRGFLASIISHFPRLANLHIVVNHYHLDKCYPTFRTCNGMLCLEKNFTPEQRADLIFTEDHVDLIRNLNQYRINKIRPELHPRMRHFRQPTEIEELSIDEDTLRNEMRSYSKHFTLPNIQFQTVVTRGLAAIEMEQWKEYLADILEARKGRKKEEDRAAYAEPRQMC
ncbi:hypothetical protein BCON_0137g00280 [Botryotinia convoluta]|uniref:2EXR domain-containing protein n=1 Tax=Botryotinia convoluta TaxID=54673 RepID=A0A4Z1HUJ2_9HELO|nr:hypothetical protein BCON_0137g00280 [Botryotinia convoluta]